MIPRASRDSKRDKNMHVDPFAGDLDHRDAGTRNVIGKYDKSQINGAREMTDRTSCEAMARHSTSLLRLTLPLVLRGVKGGKNHDAGGYFECHRWLAPKNLKVSTTAKKIFVAPR